MPDSPAPPLVLASSSPYRRELLARLELPHQCRSPDIDESPHPGEAPRELAARLAAAKARALADVFPAHLILGSDQVAECDGEALGKPGGAERAREQLRRASGREVHFHTAVAVLDTATGRLLCAQDLTRVVFRTLAEAEIVRYLEREAPWDCAGSFRAEGLGITLFEAVHSEDPTALIGLPLIRLARLLRGFGVTLP